MLKKLLFCALIAVCSLAFGQSAPALYNGLVPTAAQWESYFSAKQDWLTPGPLGNVISSNGAGTWVSAQDIALFLPPQTVAGTSYPFGAADFHLKTRRSNSGAAMTDTLPAASTIGLINGTQINIVNADSTATDTVTAGAGTTIAGSSTFIVQPGRDLWLTYDLANTAWRGVANTGDSILFSGTPATASQLWGGSATPGSGSAVAIGACLTLSGGILYDSCGGTVIGPGSSVSGYLPQWSGTTGLVLSAGVPVGTTGNNTVVETNGSGVIAASILPVPTASTLGGIESIASLSNYWISYIDTSGVPHQAQPGFSNLSGSAACSQEPAFTGDATTSAGSCATTVAKINGTSLAGLGTGLLKNTTGTGVPSIAVSGTDYAPATSGTSILKASSGGFANAVAGTDYPATGVISATGPIGSARCLRSSR